MLQKVETLSLDKTNQIALPANKGLVAYRKGKALEGRLLYEKAIAIARCQPDHEHESVARVYLALEELRAGSSEAEALRNCSEASTNLTNPSYIPLVERLRRYRRYG